MQLTDVQRQFIALRRRIEALKEELKHTQEEYDNLMGPLAEAMVANGQRLTQIDGVKLVVENRRHVNRIPGTTTELLIDALAYCAPELVKQTVNANSLQAYVLAEVDERGEVPEPLRPLVKVVEVPMVKVFL